MNERAIVLEQVRWQHVTSSMMHKSYEDKCCAHHPNLIGYLLIPISSHTDLRHVLPCLLSALDVRTTTGGFEVGKGIGNLKWSWR